MLPNAIHCLLTHVRHTEAPFLILLRDVNTEYRHPGGKQLQRCRVQFPQYSPMNIFLDKGGLSVDVKSGNWEHLRTMEDLKY